MSEYMKHDYLWIVAKPRNGSSDAIEKMNATLLAYDPNTPAREHPELFRYAIAIVEEQNPISIANLFRSIIRPSLRTVRR